MTSPSRPSPFAPEPVSFRHEAAFYDGDAGFMDVTLPFIRAGVDAGEPMLVAVSAEKGTALRSELGAAAGAVSFVDMSELGRNPARIIPAWQEFLDAHAGRPARGIGEPVWAGRSPDELRECHRHETLLNVAFADTGPWWLRCPYDLAGLDPSVIAEARNTHPVVRYGDGAPQRGRYRPDPAALVPSGDPLPEPTAVAVDMTVGPAGLGAARRLVADCARAAGLGPERTEDMLIAVNEVATNSLSHGGGCGRLRLWEQDGSFVCEVSDDGRLDDPLAGRRLPATHRAGGRGLWLVNHLCDLVQQHSSALGTVVRLHMQRPASSAGRLP